MTYYYELAKMMLVQKIECIPIDLYKRPLLKFAEIAEITNEFIEDNKSSYVKAKGLGALTRGIWCIDIDISDEYSGFISLRNTPFFNELVVNAQKTLVQVTPSGGRHVIFKKHDGVNYSQHIGYFPHVDIKANNNNYFVLASSQSIKGVYTCNDRAINYYNGALEEQIFSGNGTYQQQILEKHSVKKVLKNYDFSHLNHAKTGHGRGKQAFERIITGQSLNRNDDLYKAVSYAKTCNVPIEPLRCLIGDIKDGDEFTEIEWESTVLSAINADSNLTRR